MSGPGAGFEYPTQAVSWLKRDVLLFANSIGCTDDELHFLYVCLQFLYSQWTPELGVHRVCYPPHFSPPKPLQTQNNTLRNFENIARRILACVPTSFSDVFWLRCGG
jgi:hypothetical protein